MKFAARFFSIFARTEKMNIHHFILTRFNVNIYAIDFPKRLEKTWLDHRFELFQKFCFPSVVQQTNQNFSWLVLFDEQTSNQYKQLIRAFCRYKNFIPLYCGAYNTIIPKVINEMKNISPDAKNFVSTRLDNDDSLSKKFTQTLHSVIESLLKNNTTQQKIYINFPNGLQYKDSVFYNFRDITNAFVSLLEPSSSPNTVFWVDHPAIYSVAPVVQVEGPALWLQVLHDLNVYNYIRGPATDIGDMIDNFPSCIF